MSDVLWKDQTCSCCEIQVLCPLCKELKCLPIFACHLAHFLKFLFCFQFSVIYYWFFHNSFIYFVTYLFIIYVIVIYYLIIVIFVIIYFIIIISY